MSETVLVKVDIELLKVFDNIKKSVKERIKKIYKIDDIEITGTLASRILAAAYNNQNIDFKIKKSKNKLNIVVTEIKIN